MRTKRTIALIGLGNAAQSIHIPAYQKLTALEIVGGHDQAYSSKSNAAFEFPIYDSFETLLTRCKPDIVSIACPTQYHYEIAAKALHAGCHVFCEKPFTSTLEEAKELIEIAEKNNRWIIVNNEFRFMNIYQAAKAKIGTAGFGDLLFVNAQQNFHVTEQTEAGWRGSDLQRTCKEFGIHVLDLCRYFFEEEPLTIRARMPKPGAPAGADYLNLIELEFSGDRVAQITLDRLTKGKHRYLDMRLVGSQSSIETEFGGSLQLNAGIRAGDRKPYINFDFSPAGRALQYHGEKRRKLATDPLDIFAEATSKLLSDFLYALDNDTVPACCAQDNIKTLALMLAAYESNELGRALPFAAQWS